MTVSSPLDAGYRHTSGFMTRARPNHAGDDYANGAEGGDVYAPLAGTVVAAGTGVLAGHSGNIVVIDHGVVNGDKMVTNYGHLSFFTVSRGQRVHAGQKIGLVGNTGNSTGPHLHGGVRCNGRWIGFDAWLARKGINVGVTPPSVYKGPVVQPAGTPGKDGNSAADNLAIQAYLKTEDFYLGKLDGVNGPVQKHAVRAYQEAQVYFPGLAADGHWGPATQAHKDWTEELQQAMNSWAGYDVAVDGNYMAGTRARVTNVMQRNHGGAYQGYPDGVPGPVFCQMIGITTHPYA